jgi:hypothetical protein
MDDVLDVGDAVGEFDPEEPDSELVVMGPVDEEGLEEGMEPEAAGMKTVTGLEIVYAPIIVFVESPPVGSVNVSKVVDATNR